MITARDLPVLFMTVHYRADVITGADIKRARGRLHLSQTQLARQIGVSLRTVAEWEGSSGPLSDRIVGRLSGVFADLEPSTAAVPLSEVSDLELIAEMARRLSSLRSQIPGGVSDRPGDTAAGPGETTQTGQRSDKTDITSPSRDADYSGDASASGTVGTDIQDDSTDDARRFTDRHDAC